MVPGVIGYIPEFRGVTGTPRRLLGLMDPIGGRGEEAKGQPHAPPPKSELDKEGGRRPPFLPPLSPFLPPLLLGQGKEGVLLPVGVGLCRCQNRRISGRGSRTVRLRSMVTGDKGHDVYPGSGPLYGGNTLRLA